MHFSYSNIALQEATLHCINIALKIPKCNSIFVQKHIINQIVVWFQTFQAYYITMQWIEKTYQQYNIIGRPRR